MFAVSGLYKRLILESIAFFLNKKIWLNEIEARMNPEKATPRSSHP